MNTFIKSVLVLFIILIAAVIADYFTLLGITEKKVLGFSELTFKPRDIDTKEPIYNAKATCFRHGDHDICTIKESQRRAEKFVTVQFPLHIIETNTWLFHKDSTPILPEDPNIKIMVIHGDFASVTNDFNMHDIHANPGQVIEVEMQRRYSKQQGSDDE